MQFKAQLYSLQNIYKKIKNVIIVDLNSTDNTRKIVEKLQEEYEQLKILNLKDCKDPDDFIKKYGFEGYKKAIDESDYYIKFKI